MRTALCVGAWWCVLWSSSVLYAQPTQSPVTQPLPDVVQSALQRSGLPRDAVSLVVVPVHKGAAPRLSWNAQVGMNPASVMKLVTTYAALDLLGPAFVWETPVYVDGVVRDGILKGSVYIQGQGDPKLVLERVWLMLRRLQALGIERIEGDIVLDRSAFAVADVDPAEFDGDPARPYNVGADALLLNYKSVVMSFTPDVTQGIARIQYEPALAGVYLPASVPLIRGECGDWRAALKAVLNNPARISWMGGYPQSCGSRVWPVAYTEPKTFNARMLTAMSKELGIGVSGEVREGVVPAQLKPAFVVQSPALSEVIRDINKFSNNVMAQQLFLTLSWKHKGRGQEQDSREVMRQWWEQRFGTRYVPVVDNGSGLSRHTRISAQALALMLQTAWSDNVMPELLASLPVSGVDGTLRNMGKKDAAVAGAAHLKTGHLRDVSAIAGIVHGQSGQRYVLVAIANHPQASAFEPVIQALIAWTARDGGKGAAP